MKGGFPFHKYTMVYFQRETKIFHKIVINSQCLKFSFKIEYASLKDHLFPTGKKKRASEHLFPVELN